MGLIDCHCHLSDPRLAGEVQAILARAQAAGVERFILAGFDAPDWKRQFEICMAHPGVFPVFGIHPWAAAALRLEDTVSVVEEWLATLEIVVPVGLGEMGLDRSDRCPASTLPAQMAVFRGQLAVAKQIGLPVVLHIVKAHGLALETLQEVGLSEAGGLVHSFSGSAEMARAYEGLGLHLSFSASILRHDSKKTAAAVRAVSTDRLLIETDSPDQHLPGNTRGEPADLPEVLKRVAELRGVASATLGPQCTANAEALFRLPG